jgi:glutamate dehydrogenase
LDYVGVREFDAAGNITGVHRFIGLLTASAYTSSISTVPLISQKAAAVIAELGLGQNTHSGKDLQQFLETYPRDDMFQISVSELTAIAREALRLQERRQVRAFMRVDNFSRFASFLVYFPRDRYTTAVRMRMESILLAELGGAVIDHSARVSSSRS